MRPEEKYEGCRLTLEARLAGAQIAVQVDFGFGDAITPAAQLSSYPTLLPDLGAPLLRAYPRETVVAEKFQALVALELFNSRLKDFFDLWTLAQHFSFEGDLLRRAIANTFARRETLIPTQTPVALTLAFTGDPAKIAAWKAFGRRSEIADLPALEAVAARLNEFLMPVTGAALQTDSWPMGWQPQSGWTNLGLRP